MNTQLELHRSLYENLVRVALQTPLDAPEEAASLVEDAATFAFHEYPGLLSDYRLENRLNSLGANLRPPRPRLDAGSSCGVLHIATELYNVGGHARVLQNWIDQDDSGEARLVLTRQRAPTPSPFLRNVKRELPVIRLKPRSKIGSAMAIRRIISKFRPRLVVLHHHPFDVIPIIALSTSHIPPVILYNHSDHTFGLGPSVADLYVDFRDLGAEFSKNRRLARESTVLPYPLAHVNVGPKDRIRRELGIEPDQVFMVSMGTAYKYRPFQDLNFFKFYVDFLRSHPKVLMFVIGVAPEDLSSMGISQLPVNLRCLGRISDPVKIAVAADFFVEPFPFCTGLGTYDVVRHGALPIPNYDEVSIYAQGVRSILPRGIFERTPKTLAEYSQCLTDELSALSDGHRVKEKVSMHIEECIFPKWRDNLHQLYRDLECMEHRTGMPQQLIGCGESADERYSQFCASLADPIENFGLARERGNAEKLKKSWSWSVGRFVTWPIKQIRDKIST